MSTKFCKPLIDLAAVLVPLSTALLSVALAVAVDRGRDGGTHSTTCGPRLPSGSGPSPPGAPGRIRGQELVFGRACRLTLNGTKVPNATGG